MPARQCLKENKDIFGVTMFFTKMISKWSQWPNFTVRKNFDVYVGVSFLKMTPTQLFSCGYCKSFKNTYFEEYLQCFVWWYLIHSHYCYLFLIIYFSENWGSSLSSLFKTTGLFWVKEKKTVFFFILFFCFYCLPPPQFQSREQSITMFLTYMSYAFMATRNICTRIINKKEGYESAIVPSFLYI